MRNRLLPPRYLNAILVLAVGLHFIIPIKRIIHSPYTYLGLIIILFGAALNIRSASLLKKNATTDFHESSTNLVTDGPFRISRNPLYLGGVILALGIAVLLGTLITFVFPTALFLALDRLYIPAEEARLERTFGKEYLEYKQRVRRWI